VKRAAPPKARRVRTTPARPLPGRREAGAPPGAAYLAILAIVRRIPRGRVATYGQVAALAGYAHAPRLAGYALHALPEGTPLPWHRVLGAGGRISLARLSPDGAVLQRLRLEAEGVTFGPRGRVRIEIHSWRPRARRSSRPPRRGGDSSGG